MELVIIGDSHTVALAAGYEAMRSSGQWHAAAPLKIAKLFPSPTTLADFFVEEPGKILLLDPTASDVLEKLLGRRHFSKDDSDKVFAFALGFTTTVLLSRDDWKSHVSWDYPERQGKQLLSRAVFRTIVLNYSKPVLAFYRSILNLGLRCVAVCAPPQMAGDKWHAKGVPADAILAIDYAARRILHDEFASLGIACVSPPPETYLGNSEQNHRCPEYADPGKGVVHANAAYGQLMIPRIIEATKNLTGI